MSWDAEEVSLNDETQFQTLNGLWTGKTPPLVEAGVIRNTNFTESGRIDYSDVAWLQVEERKLATRQLQPGDIIIERSGGGPKQPVGRVVYFARDDGPFSFSNFTTAVRVRDLNAFDSRFVFYRLLELYQRGGTEDIQRRTTGIRNLDFAAYKDRATVPRLPLAEQKEIAGLLDVAHDAMDREDELLALVTELRSRLRRQLFTEGVRGEPTKQTEIGVVPESWKLVPLGSMAKVGNGSTPKRTNDAYWHGGFIPWLNSAKIHDRFVTQAEQFVTELAVKECHLPRVPAGSLLVAITGQGKTLGNAALTTFETCINQHLAYAAFNTEDVLPEFVLWFIATRYEHLRAVAQAGGSTKGALTCGYLKTYPIPVPSLDEQREIAEALSCVERKLDIHRQRGAALREVFQALLRELATGVAVFDSELEAVAAAAE